MNYKQTATQIISAVVNGKMERIAVQGNVMRPLNAKGKPGKRDDEHCQRVLQAASEEAKREAARNDLAWFDRS